MNNLRAFIIQKIFILQNISKRLLIVRYYKSNVVYFKDFFFSYQGRMAKFSLDSIKDLMF